MADDLIRDPREYYAVTGEHPIIRSDSDPAMEAVILHIHECSFCGPAALCETGHALWMAAKQVMEAEVEGQE